MINFPQADFALFIRTDFTNQTEWETICKQIDINEFDLSPMVTILDDPKYSDLQIEELPRFGVSQNKTTFAFIIDKECIASPDHYILCVDLNHEFGSSFRTIPAEVYAISANLGFSNMDFIDFANNVDEDGIFRGFKKI